MTGSHNKTGKADHSAEKFAVNIPYIIGNLCSKFGGNWFISAWQHICYSALYAVVRPSACPSVHHMGGSVKDGWS